jgi:hypothetical protein
LSVLFFSKTWRYYVDIPIAIGSNALPASTSDVQGSNGYIASSAAKNHDDIPLLHQDPLNPPKGKNIEVFMVKAGFS